MKSDTTFETQLSVLRRLLRRTYDGDRAVVQERLNRLVEFEDREIEESRRLEFCNDCGDPIYWNEETRDYRHEESARNCFLIAAEPSALV